MKRVFGSYSARKGEFDSAWEWVGEIQDPVEKKNAERSIWGQEKKAVSSEANRNPASLMSDLVSGSSVHADYWIKEVFSTWVSNSQKEAESWYAGNRETLRPDQNQHIARHFAEVAISEGDHETAKSWIGQITEGKFRDQLNNQLNNNPEAD